MNVIETAIPGVLIVEPRVFDDTRGFLMEAFQADRYAAIGIVAQFVQDNFSRSVQGVLRGLHFQSPKLQGKLVTVLRGRVHDVAVDIRVGSPSFGQHVAVDLNDVNRRQLWIPRGFAHGFLVLSETADVLYKCDEFYCPSDEIVLRWNDPVLDIHWGCDTPKLSARDGQGCTLAELQERLPRYDSIAC
jgi:dTDP-4-dehydrorhamnose 3,5-epimerase